MQLWNYFRLSVENQSNEQTNTPYGVNGKRRIWSLFWNTYVCMLASGRGGRIPDFKWTGMTEWDQKSKPPKIPRASNKNPENAMPNLWALKISRRGKQVWLNSHNFAGTITNLKIILNSQNNPYLNLAI